uniref:Putative secreted peptide n=1 Tax=Rhipicephalus pulchellus TaxID=72859 RepID=L7MA35_RHIPC
MRAAVVALILLAITPVAIDAGIGRALAKILAKLPKALKVVTLIRPRKSIVRVLLGSRAQMSTLLGLDAINTALDFVPPPGGFQSGPEGYRGPGISGTAKVLKGGYTWSGCTSCECRFIFNASFYGNNIGCTSSARLKCTCATDACTEGRMAECANEVAAKPLLYA